MNTKNIDTTKTLGKLGYATAIELSGAGDIARITAGVDPYTGEELTNQERFEEWAEWVATPTVINGAAKITKINQDIFDSAKNIRDINNGFNKINDYETKR